VTFSARHYAIFNAPARPLLSDLCQVACLPVRVTELTNNLSKAHETWDSPSSSCLQNVLVYLHPFRRSSPMKCAPQLKIAKNNTKTPYFGDFIQGHRC